MKSMDYDESTKKLAEEIINILQTRYSEDCFEKEARNKIRELRLSARESLAIALRALEKYEWKSADSAGVTQFSEAAEAIAAIKARGDWISPKNSKEK